MKSLLLKLPQIKGLSPGRPTACPKCQHPALQRWGKAKKPLKDIKLQEDFPQNRQPPVLRSLRDRRLALGTWQGIYLCEHRNRGGARRLVLTLWGESK